MLRMPNRKTPNFLISMIFSVGLVSFSNLIFSAEVEVLHYWSSVSELSALESLKQNMKDRGHQWKDFVKSGAGGESTRDIMVSRILKGDPPSAALIKGTAIERWARLGYLRRMSNLASSQNWPSLMNPIISTHMQYQGEYVAIPINIHRTNWVWSNKKLLAELSIEEPTTWDEFIEALAKVKAAGKIPLVHGNEPWQNATLFEAIVMSTGNWEMYREAFVNHNTSVLHSDAFAEAFRRYLQLTPYLQVNKDNTSWDYAIKQVMDGEAAFQVVGDWAKGEFTANGMIAEEDFGCFPMPGSEGAFLYNVDSLAIFKLQDKNKRQGQTDLIQGVLEKPFQIAFNRAKGSIPVRKDIDKTAFDLCAQKSIEDFNEADINNSLLPSIAHGMATSPYIVDAFFNVIQTMVNDKPENSLGYQKKLARSIKKAQYVIH